MHHNSCGQTFCISSKWEQRTCIACTICSTEQSKNASRQYKNFRAKI